MGVCSLSDQSCLVHYNEGLVSSHLAKEQALGF